MRQTEEPDITVREWTVDGIGVLSASVEVPQPPSAAERVQRRIRRFYRLQGRAFLRYCEWELLPRAEAEYRAALAASAPLPQFHGALTCAVTYQAGSLWSLCTQIRETAPPGPALTTHRGDTWDLAEGYPVPLSAFFPPRSHWRQAALSAAAETLERREAAGGIRLFPDWRRRLRRSFDPRSFYLTDSGIALFFPMGAIAPAVEGVPTVLLPYGSDPPRRAP